MLVINGVLEVRDQKRSQIIDDIVSHLEITSDEASKLLTSCSISRLSHEDVEEIEKESREIKAELESLMATTPEQMWINDIEEFLVAFKKYT